MGYDGKPLTRWHRVLFRDSRIVQPAFELKVIAETRDSEGEARRWKSSHPVRDCGLLLSMTGGSRQSQTSSYIICKVSDYASMSNEVL